MTVELATKLLACKHTLLILLSKIEIIEKDIQTPIIDRLAQIKIIREEINKVGMEIDKLKKEIKLVNAQYLPN